MAEIIQFVRKHRRDEYPTFTKIVDGEAFECVDVDALSPRQRERFFESTAERKNLTAD